MSTDDYTTADHQLEAFLAEITYEQARLDYAPTTETEIRHLAHARTRAA